MKMLLKRTLITLGLFFASLSLFAANSVLSVPDSSEIRKAIIETWLTAPLSELETKQSEYMQDKTGLRYEIRLEKAAGELAIVVSPQQSNLTYPRDAEGSWILYRDSTSGAALRIQFYFSGDKNIYLQFRPAKPKNLVDFVLYNTYLVRNVSLGIDFETLYTAPFSLIYTLTQGILPWHYVEVDSKNYPHVLQMVAVIRKNLHRFEYIQDAGYDEHGNAIFLKNGDHREDSPARLGVNCAGFVKWIIDGIVEPLTGRGLAVSTLKVLTVPVEGTRYEAILDQEPFFAIDWNRNLAAAVLAANMDKDITAENSGADVRIEPFAAFVDKVGYKRSVGYLKDTGYHRDLLRSMMYILASSNPDSFYLVAVRTSDGKNPETWKFSHTAALFPYFDEEGQLQVVVFESGIETAFDDFIARNKESFFHISRVKTAHRFFPR